MESQKRLVFFATNVLALLGWISMNIYLPSIPALEAYFHASPTDLKLSISFFLLGFSLSQFFWGSLSERWGRIKPILYGLFLADCGTLMVLLAPNIMVFNMARFIEGVGIGAAAVLTRTLLADSFSKIELSKAFSWISTSANIMPALAPIVGGYLLLFGGWRAIFIFLMIYTTFLILLFLKKVAETHPAINPDFRLGQALKQYVEVVSHRQFLGYLSPYVLISGGMIGFYAATPFIFMNVLHMAPQHYSFLMLFTVGAYIVGANVSSRLAKIFGFNPSILLGIGVTLIAGLLFWGCTVFSSLNTMTVIIPMMFYVLGAGLIAPNANAAAMTQVPQMVGAAGAVMGSVVYACSAVLSAVITALDLSRLSSLAAYVSILGILALLSFLMGCIWKKDSTDIEYK